MLPTPLQLPVDIRCFVTFVPAPTTEPIAALVTAILRDASNTGTAPPVATVAATQIPIASAPMPTLTKFVAHFGHSPISSDILTGLLKQ